MKKKRKINIQSGRKSKRVMKDGRQEEKRGDGNTSNKKK